MISWSWGYYPEKEQLAIAYLFLSLESSISDSHFSLFEEIGKSIEGFPAMKGEIIGECEKILASPDNSKSRYEIVSELFSSYSFKTETTTFLGEHQKGYRKFVSEHPSLQKGNSKIGRMIQFGSSLPILNRVILWTLANLHQRIKDKSDKRQQLIELWVESTQIDNSIVLEMDEIRETENDLNDYRKYLESCNDISTDESDSIIQELEKNRASLIQSVNDIIALG
jgi:hypothetical protein